MIPCKTVAEDTALPIFFKLAPLITNLRVLWVYVALKEYGEWKGNGHVKTSTRTLVKLKDKNFKFKNSAFEGSLVLEIPPGNPTGSLIRDCHNSFISISHKIRVRLCIEYPASGATCTFTGANGHPTTTRVVTLSALYLPLINQQPRVRRPMARVSRAWKRKRTMAAMKSANVLRDYLCCCRW